LESLAGAIATNKATAQLRLSGDSIVNALSERGIVQVKGADNDTCMVWLHDVETDEMLAVEGDKHALLGGGEGEDGLIGNGLACLADLHRGEDIVPKLPLGFDHWQRQILIGVEPRHTYAASFSLICCSISSGWARA
jgi:hypothetical protein